jgi:hypothetical protein
MVTRQPKRVETRVTRGVPSHDDHVLVDQNVSAAVEGHESRDHCGKSLNEAIEYPLNGQAVTISSVAPKLARVSQVGITTLLY